MESVQADTAKLIETLKSNRTKHVSEYETALQGWKVKVVEELQEATTKALAGKEYKTEFKLPKPQNHEKDYDDIIGLLELHVNPSIDLDFYTYRQYVLDEWTWKQAFTTTNSQYV